MMNTRYFAVNPKQCRDFKTVFVPDNDFLPLDEIPNCRHLCTLKDGRILLHVLLGPVQLKNMQELAEVDDPLSLEAVKTLGLASSYVGSTPKEVRAITGEKLAEIVEYVDEETGKKVSYEHDFLNHRWAI